jgi:FtsP/CotA-like multicopper oxidase with cupredoxin domain
MVRIGPMASPEFPLNRRELMAGLGAAALSPLWPATGAAQGRPGVLVRLAAGSIALRAGSPDTPVWSLSEFGGRFRQGDVVADLHYTRGHVVDILLENDLPVPAVLNWRSIDGAASAEPLTGRPPIAPGGKDTFQIPLRHAGTYLCDAKLLADGQVQPSRARPLIVAENERIAVDKDEICLIEDWRLRADQTAIAPGTDAKDTTPVYTVNGQTSFDLSARTNERLRIRFINGCQRSVIAIKLENNDVRVMAVDGQPAEPFPARNGALVLAPGGRVDAFVDATAPAGTSSSILLHDGKEARPIGKLVVSNFPPTRPAPMPPALPLPSNGLPERLDLRNATRVDLPLGGPPGDWVTPVSFTATAPPAFRTKAGRVVVLALTNRAAIATVFHLHGHHFRLLDRLDDGWKPFWLDTLAIEPGQTQRIAFRAEHAGRYLIESVATDWAAPRLVRWYAVE